MKTNIIKEKRIEKGIELFRIAQSLGISDRQYRRIENSEFKTIDLRIVEKLSKILNIELIDLINYYLGKEDVI